MDDYSAEVRWLRQRLGLTQAEFARAMGVSQPRISRWEAGSDWPTVAQHEALRRLAERPPFRPARPRDGR